MSAPLIWIGLPGLAALLVFVFRSRQRLALAVSLGLALGLAWLALSLPVGERISLGPLTTLPFIPPEWSVFTIGDTLSLLGRRLVLGQELLPLLSLVYFGLAFWLGGAFLAHPGELFAPASLGLTALLTAALTVEPFLYAALFIEMAALVSVPLLLPPGQPAGRGLLRFLTFQTLGMPFILFAGWQLGNAQAALSSTDLVLRSTLLLSLGFAFMMGLFPFHSWIPMLAGEAQPYAAAFILFMLPTIISIFGLGFFERYTWLRDLPAVSTGLRGLGALMVATGGIWAAFQHHLGRMLGYAVLLSTGMVLLALSLEPGAGFAQAPALFFALLLPRLVGMALWALALVVLQDASPDLNFRAVQGLARRLPVAATSLVAAQLALAGFPLLAAFPVYLALVTALAPISLPVTLLLLVGLAGLLAGSLRSMAVLVMGVEEGEWQVHERWPQIALLALGVVLLLLLGLTPQWLFPALIGLTSA